MKSLTQAVRYTVAALAFAFALAAMPTAQAADENIGLNVASIPVSTKLTKSDVEQSLQHCLVARRWLVREKTDGEIVAFYSRGNNVCTLTIRYDAEKIEIFAVGQARGGGLPMRWIERLKLDITQDLSTRLVTK